MNKVTAKNKQTNNTSHQEHYLIHTWDKISIMRCPWLKWIPLFIGLRGKKAILEDFFFFFNALERKKLNGRDITKNHPETNTINIFC